MKVLRGGRGRGQRWSDSISMWPSYELLRLSQLVNRCYLYQVWLLIDQRGWQQIVLLIQRMDPRGMKRGWLAMPENTAVF